jgi:hypothetical protein
MLFDMQAGIPEAIVGGDDYLEICQLLSLSATLLTRSMDEQG